MRTRLKTTAVVCCVYVFGMIAGAGSFKAAAQQPSVQDADTSSVMCFTLDEAMSYALEHNWDLQNSSLAVRQAEADRWGAIATMLPQVNGTLDYSNYMGYEMEFGETGLAIAMPPYGSIGVNAAMSVSGAQIISALIGKLSIEMADVSHRQSQQEVAEQVRLLYFSALVSTQTVELLRRNLGTVRKLHEFSQKSVDAGVAEQVDADQILVQVATLESSINEAERGLEMIYNSMRLQMNVGFDKEIVLTQTLDELMDVEHSLDLLYDDFILENNAEHRAVQKAEKPCRMGLRTYPERILPVHGQEVFLRRDDHEHDSPEHDRPDSVHPHILLGPQLYFFPEGQIGLSEAAQHLGEHQDGPEHPAPAAQVQPFLRIRALSDTGEERGGLPGRI